MSENLSFSFKSRSSITIVFPITWYPLAVRLTLSDTYLLVSLLLLHAWLVQCQYTKFFSHISSNITAWPREDRQIGAIMSLPLFSFLYLFIICVIRAWSLTIIYKSLFYDVVPSSVINRTPFFISHVVVSSLASKDKTSLLLLFPPLHAYKPLIHCL